MTISTHAFCWHGIHTAPASKDFYAHVLGWTAEQPPMEPLTFSAPNGQVAHLQPLEDERPAWCSYLAVDDLEAATARAADGGTILVPPTKLPPGSAFSIVASPSGAVFGLYQPIEADVIPEAGAGVIHWVELHSAALDDDTAWLERAFGIELKEEQMPIGPYSLFRIDDQPRWGALRAEQSHWLAWVQVDNLDTTLKQVTSHGGAIVKPTHADPGIGIMAVVADPSGAVFGVIQPEA